jgi:hypothetical protein
MGVVVTLQGRPYRQYDTIDATLNAAMPYQHEDTEAKRNIARTMLLRLEEDIQLIRRTLGTEAMAVIVEHARQRVLSLPLRPDPAAPTLARCD